MSARSFTVNAWTGLLPGDDGKPTLMMMVVYEGRMRPSDCAWTKVVEAEDWRKAYAIGEEYLRAGDPGDPIDSIPVCPPKPQAEICVETSKVNKPKKKSAA